MFFVIVYIDDILIYSSSESEHKNHVKQVLQALQKHQLFAKLEKCEFHVTTVQFLGFVISPEGLTMDDSKVQAILQWKSPKNVKGVQRFLGFANFYWRFYPNFSQIV